MECLRRIPRKRKPASPEASGASRGLFYAVPKARSLKTQQRAFTPRPHPSWMWLRTKTCLHPSGWDFEHKLKVTKDWPVYRPPFSTERLILAQDERWRRAQYMQVAREPGLRPRRQRQTGEEH